MSNERATVLFVDDEERILRSMKMLFRGVYNILTTTDGYEAIEMVRNQTVHVVVSDQRMPKMLGVDLLHSLKEISPDTMRILLTGYSDLAAIVGSVNEGEIFRYINKPWIADELKNTVGEAVDIAMSMRDTHAQIPAEARNSAGILVIDSDEESVLKVREAANDCPVYWGADLDSAFELLEQENIGVVVSELRDNGEDYSDAIKQLKVHNPAVVTIVTTGYKDGAVIIGLINEGQVFRYHPKPVRVGMLNKNIESAMQHHHRLKAAPGLIKRHAVHRPQTQSTPRFSNKVMDYFKRLRATAA